MLPPELTVAAGRAATALRDRGQTVAVAEGSCGGLVSASLLAVPGASVYYAGGAVIYTMAASRAFLADAVRGAAPASGCATRRSSPCTWPGPCRSGWPPPGEWGRAGRPARRATGTGDPPGHAWVAVSGPSESTSHVLTRLGRPWCQHGGVRGGRPRAAGRPGRRREPADRPVSPAWTCPGCGRQFGRVRQPHECAPAMALEEYFATGPDRERPIFEAVTAALDQVGPVHVEPVSVGIFLKRSRTFAELRPMQQWVALSFSLPRRERHPRITRKVVPYRRRTSTWPTCGRPPTSTTTWRPGSGRRTWTRPPDRPARYGFYPGRMADWATISSLATAAGTLVLAVATFSSVRSGNRAARTAERALQVGLRPVLFPARLQDPPQKIRWGDDHWARLDGGRAVMEEVDGIVYLALSLRNVGSGIAVIHGWRPVPDGTIRRRNARTCPSSGSRPATCMYRRATTASGRPPSATRRPDRAGILGAIMERRLVLIDLLYGDHEGGQRTISRFSVTPPGCRRPGLAVLGRAALAGRRCGPRVSAGRRRRRRGGRRRRGDQPRSSVRRWKSAPTGSTGWSWTSTQAWAANPCGPVTPITRRAAVARRRSSVSTTSDSSRQVGSRRRTIRSTRSARRPRRAAAGTVSGRERYLTRLACPGSSSGRGARALSRRLASR